MSRIGRLPITIPSGVTVEQKDGEVRVKGPKGQLAQRLPAGITMAVEAGAVRFARPDDSNRMRSLHGLARQLVANMVEGVTKGFTRVLEITGVGYRADVRGNILWLTLGYSHPIAYQLPPGVSAKVDKQVTITLEGSDRQLLGEVAAAIRGLRPPEPYKGKGVRYAGEQIRRKAGKAAAGASR
ncbi:MAG TPA: 50S ribosomal protein L6 [Candidatus Limnocylindria bacterium]|nr:50S ribosomal protein L6 [Candidatus Limnocylindria bacterium]